MASAPRAWSPRSDDRLAAGNRILPTARGATDVPVTAALCVARLQYHQAKVSVFGRMAVSPCLARVPAPSACSPPGPLFWTVPIDFRGAKSGCCQLCMAVGGDGKGGGAHRLVVRVRCLRAELVRVAGQAGGAWRGQRSIGRSIGRSGAASDDPNPPIATTTPPRARALEEALSEGEKCRRMV